MSVSEVIIDYKQTKTDTVVIVSFCLTNFEFLEISWWSWWGLLTTEGDIMIVLNTVWVQTSLFASVYWSQWQSIPFDKKDSLSLKQTAERSWMNLLNLTHKFMQIISQISVSGKANSVRIQIF